VETYKIKKNIIFRLNFNKYIGLGHLIRCLRIIKELEKKYKIFLVFDKQTNNKEIFKLIKKYNLINLYDSNKNFVNQNKDSELFLKKTSEIKRDIIIIDDYRFNIIWHKKIKKFTKKLIVIDDFLNKKTYCDYYINYKLIKNNNFFKLMAYKNTKLLLGKDYLILDKNIKKIINNKNSVNILINFGNSFDFKKIKTLLNNLFICKFQKKVTFIIYIGIFAKNYNYIFELKKKYKNIKLQFKKTYIETIFDKIDLFIGSAGNSIYENSYLKIPSIFFETSSNQENDIHDLMDLGHFFAFKHKEFKNNKCAELIKNLINNLDRVSKLNDYRKIQIKRNGTKKIVKELNI